MFRLVLRRQVEAHEHHLKVAQVVLPHHLGQDGQGEELTSEVQSNLVQGGDGAGHGNLLALLVHSADVLEQTSEHDGLGRLLVPGGEEVVVS